MRFWDEKVEIQQKSCFLQEKVRPGENDENFMKHSFETRLQSGIKFQFPKLKPLFCPQISFRNFNKTTNEFPKFQFLKQKSMFSP